MSRVTRATTLLTVPVLIAAVPVLQPDFLSLTKVTTVGEMEGSPQYTFGLVNDIVADRAGNVYVLDERAPSLTVRVFDPHGRFRAGTGRPGAGPGEFRDPVALALDSRELLYVLDRQNARVTTFRLVGSELQLQGSFRIDFTASDMCILDDRLFVLGYHRERIVQELTLDGDLRRSIGVPIRTESPILADASAMAHIECAQREKTIIVAQRVFPVVTAYSSETGRPLWRRQLAGFQQVGIEILPNGGVTYSAPGGRHDMVTGLVFLPSGDVLVQFGQVSPDAKGPEEVIRVTTQAFSAVGGEERERSTRLPRLDAAAASHIYSIENQPYPRFSSYRYAVRR